MDVFSIIEQQVKQLQEKESSPYLHIIFKHLERAELYYISGSTDASFYNDVIYRANQAFEGALKEAFKVLALDKANSKNFDTPAKIEAYFTENQVFRMRVMQLFQNYRQEWRNKSTHQYDLIFDQNEAFIALMNVSSFVHLLLKQILERIAFNIQQKELELEKEKLNVLQKIVFDKTLSFAERVTLLIIEFNKRNKEEFAEWDLTEDALSGMLHAYLTQIAGFEISRQKVIRKGGKNLRPDFEIRCNDEKVIVEVSRNKNSSSAINQILCYLEASEFKEGIVYSSPENTVRPLTSSETTIDSKSYRVFII